MDDGRVGRLVRALRHRRRWRQADLAKKAGVSQPTVSRVERGHLDELALRTIRAVLSAVEARAAIDVRWRGGLADQLIDERHAGLGIAGTVLLQRLGWHVLPEVTFQDFGERGSIDLFAARADQRAVCVVELKSGATPTRRRSVGSTSRRGSRRSSPGSAWAGSRASSACCSSWRTRARTAGG